MLVAGIDEAGRGPVIGPMTICIVVMEDADEPAFRKAGIKDSKLLSPSERKRLYSHVEKHCKEHHCIHISAKELNELMDRHSLNEIEAMKAAELIGKLKRKVARIYIDSPDTVAKRFEERIRGHIKIPEGTAIYSEHKADVKYASCGAASIIAKVERDEVIGKIREEWGHDFGSGYPSDPRTIEFLKSNISRPEVAKYVRTKWETVERLKQRKLSDF